MKSNLTSDTIFERTGGGLQFRFCNILQIISASALSTQLFFTREFDLKMKITITFLYETEF